MTPAEGDTFSNAAARASGLTDAFWTEAFRRYSEAAQADESRDLISKFFAPRVIRIDFEGRTLDVLVRTPPEDPREYVTYRLSAAAASDEPPPQGAAWGFEFDERRTILGEAAYLDTVNLWGP